MIINIMLYDMDYTTTMWIFILLCPLQNADYKHDFAYDSLQFLVVNVLCIKYSMCFLVLNSLFSHIACVIKVK